MSGGSMSGDCVGALLWIIPTPASTMRWESSVSEERSLESCTGDTERRYGNERRSGGPDTSRIFASIGVNCLMVSSQSSGCPSIQNQTLCPFVSTDAGR